MTHQAAFSTTDATIIDLISQIRSLKFNCPPREDLEKIDSFDKNLRDFRDILMYWEMKA